MPKAPSSTCFNSHVRIHCDCLNPQNLRLRYRTSKINTAMTSVHMLVMHMKQSRATYYSYRWETQSSHIGQQTYMHTDWWFKHPTTGTRLGGEHSLMCSPLLIVILTMCFTTFHSTYFESYTTTLLQCQSSPLEFHNYQWSPPSLLLQECH